MGNWNGALTRQCGRALRVAAMPMAMLMALGSVAATPAAPAPRLLWQLVEPARGIPAQDGHAVYFLSQRHELLAASITSGRLRWRVPMDATGATFGSRVIVRGDVVVAGDYDLMGVDRRSGRRVWTFAAGDGGGSGMHLGEATGDLVFSGSLAGSLHAVAITDGRPRWSLRVGDPATTTVYSPVVRGNLVAASYSDFGSSPLGGVVVADTGTARMLWRRVVPGSVGASGNAVFAGAAVVAAARDGTIHAFDSASGAPLWVLPKVERLGDEQDYRPLAVSGRTLVAGSLSGEVVAHDLLTRRVLWRRTPVVASVAFGVVAHGDVVYVPYFSNQIVALRLRDGAEVWRLGGGASQFRWVPLVHGPRLFASGANVFSAFRHDGSGRTGRW
jgi:outer membrane protein assembly factor BamB